MKTDEDLDADMRVDGDDLETLGPSKVVENVGDGSNDADSVMRPAVVNTPVGAEQEGELATGVTTQVSPLGQVELEVKLPDDKACSNSKDARDPFPQPVPFPTSTNTEITGNSGALLQTSITPRLDNVFTHSMPTPGTPGVPGIVVPDETCGGTVTQGSSSINLYPGTFTSNNWSGFSEVSASLSLNVSPGLWFEHAEINPSGLTVSHGAHFYYFLQHFIINKVSFQIHILSLREVFFEPSTNPSILRLSPQRIMPCQAHYFRKILR